MTGTVYIIVGVPGVGKSWILKQLDKLPKVIYVPNDEYIGAPQDRLDSVVYAAHNGLTVLTETPFSESQVRQPLLDEGLRVISVFVIEPQDKLTKRYEDDRQQTIPKGHATRQNTYLERAKATGAFHGTSDEVLAHMKKVLGQ